jgi:hypothetical protein
MPLRHLPLPHIPFFDEQRIRRHYSGLHVAPQKPIVGPEDRRIHWDPRANLRTFIYAPCEMCEAICTPFPVHYLA